jgi:hypothetical protein
MNDMLRLVGALLFGNLFLVAFVATLVALFPRRLAQTRAAADAMPGRAFTIGLINGLFFSALILAFSAVADRVGNELPRIPAVLLLALVGLGVSFGLAAVAELVGERLRPQTAGLVRITWGTLSLSLACSLPFVGWFLLLPYAACLGLGAFIISLFHRPTTSAPKAAME